MLRIFANAQVAIRPAAAHHDPPLYRRVESPMAIFYVFHMAIGSLLLTTWQAVVQGIWAVALYAGLACAELGGAIEHYAFLPSLSSAVAHTQPAFVISAIVVLACGVFGTLYFTLGIAARLDAREAQLRQALENLQASQKAIRELQLRRSRFMRDRRPPAREPADRHPDAGRPHPRRHREGLGRGGNHREDRPPLS